MKWFLLLLVVLAFVAFLLTALIPCKIIKGVSCGDHIVDTIVLIGTSPNICTHLSPDLCDNIRDHYNDEDGDGVKNDNDSDRCRCGETGWTSNSFTDNDGDGCRDAGEDDDDDNDGVMDVVDIDYDGDGLIELATAAELDAVRYALNGRGRRLSEGAELNTSGCGGYGGITSCSGYELVANINLATYANADGAKGWQPLGHDTNSSTPGCQGAAFEGIFEGNGWTISNLSINRPNEDCVGLFGHIAANSEIRNLTLRAETVMGRAGVGSLVGYGFRAQIVSSSVVVAEVRGSEHSVGGLVGQGGGSSRVVRPFGLSIVSSSVVAGEVSGNRSIGGLVGRGESARIDSSSVVAGKLEGLVNIGGLVGYGSSARIISSSVAVVEVKGSEHSVGGLVGRGQSAQIDSSSVGVGEVKGSRYVGGLVGYGRSARIHSSWVMVEEVRGSEHSVGGLIGNGRSARIISSLVVVGEMRGRSRVAGLMGLGVESQIYSSLVGVGEVKGSRYVGGLVGDGQSARIYSSSVRVGEVSGTGDNVGGLVGNFDSGRIAYSYALVSNTIDRWFGSRSEAAEAASYGGRWYNYELRRPTDYTGIYEDWKNDTNIFGDGMIDEPLAVWCDRDNSGSIESDERIPDNLIWDFGTDMEYPVIRCTLLPPDEWSDWWSLGGEGNPQLDRTRLNQLLPSLN